MQHFANLGILTVDFDKSDENPDVIEASNSSFGSIQARSSLPKNKSLTFILFSLVKIRDICLSILQVILCKIGHHECQTQKCTLCIPGDLNTILYQHVRKTLFFTNHGINVVFDNEITAVAVTSLASKFSEKSVRDFLQFSIENISSFRNSLDPPVLEQIKILVNELVIMQVFIERSIIIPSIRHYHLLVNPDIKRSVQAWLE